MQNLRDMLNFFRKIRKKLAEDHKPIRYMRYALGEIVLVVIGILIALQLNTWNEARKSRAKEVSYLKRLQEEFEANLALTEVNMAMSHKFEELTETALKALSNDTLVAAENLAAAIEWASYGSPSNIKNNVWQDLVSSGNSDLITNSPLRIAISEYHNMVKMHWDFYRDKWVDDHNSTHDLTSTLFSWRDRNSIAQSFSSFIQDATYTPPEISVDLATIMNKLKDLPNIETKLYTMYNLHQLGVSFDEREIAAIKDILKSLKGEIDRFN